MAKKKSRPTPSVRTRRATAPGAAQRSKPEPTADARERLLKTSMKLFAEKGFDAVSVREICSATGDNISLVSYYFGGKEGLYRTVLKEHMNRFRVDLEAAIDRFDDEEMSREVFAREIRAIIEVVVQSNMDHPEMGLIMLRERVNQMPHAAELHAEIAQPLALRLIALMERARKAGVLREGVDDKAFFISLFESIWGFLTMHRCMGSLMKDTFKLPKDKDAYIDFLTRLFSEGVLS